MLDVMQQQNAELTTALTSTQEHVLQLVRTGFNLSTKGFLQYS